MENLKSCPFCGGEAKLEDMGYPHHVFCTKCYARVTGDGYGEEGKRDAIRRWNMRKGESPVGPVYVVTAGSYSAYHIECVSFDRKKAELYKDLCYEGNEVEEYFPIEMQTEKTISENLNYIDVEYDTTTNTIARVELVKIPFKSDTLLSENKFYFSVRCNGMVGADIVKHGKDSDLAQKIAHDRYAAWKYYQEMKKDG